MTVFVKPLLLSVFAAGSLAVAGGQQEAPPPPPAAPLAPLPPTQVRLPADVYMPGMPGQRSGGAVYVGPGGQGGGFGGGFGGSFGGPAFAPLGDDPRTRDLAKKLADAKDDEGKDKLRGELKAALAKAFDDRLKGQEKQVEELEKQLKKLKEMVGKRKEAKADIVADRAAALEKDAKGLGW